MQITYTYIFQIFSLTLLKFPRIIVRGQLFSPQGQHSEGFGKRFSEGFSDGDLLRLYIKKVSDKGSS